MSNLLNAFYMRQVYVGAIPFHSFTIFSIRNSFCDSKPFVIIFCLLCLFCNCFPYVYSSNSYRTVQKKKRLESIDFRLCVCEWVWVCVYVYHCFVSMQDSLPLRILFSICVFGFFVALWNWITMLEYIYIFWFFFKYFFKCDDVFSLNAMNGAISCF